MVLELPRTDPSRFTLGMNGQDQPADRGEILIRYLWRLVAGLQLGWG